MPPIATGNEFARYRPAANNNTGGIGSGDYKYGTDSMFTSGTNTSGGNGLGGSSYPSYSDTFDGANNTSSWLHGTDFTSPTAGDLFTSGTGHSNANLSSTFNLDQIKIGDQTMENVLKALDPNSGNANANYSNLNGLNLDSSFTGKKYSSTDDYDRFAKTRNSNNYRANIIKSHNTSSKPVSFQDAPMFFSSPDESFVNMTLPALDTSLLFSEQTSKFNNSNNNNSGIYNSKQGRNAPLPPSFNENAPRKSIEREKEQFVSFAVQQYRMLAAMNPEMMREVENVEELAERECFKYWAKLFVEERERQARIVLNMQKALTEALSSSASRGPNVMTHLGAASGDFELETIGRYADQCRKRSQMISNYFNTRK